MDRKSESKRPVQAADNHPACPLCGGQMRPRRRDPLLRAAGMLLLYLALLLFLLWLPDVTVDESLAAGLCLVTGAILLRERIRPWCPACRHVATT